MQKQVCHYYHYYYLLLHRGISFVRLEKSISLRYIFLQMFCDYYI
jgi:hypothetical protein